ncbi:MAG: type II toxin-antitoxin system VapC family toxin [Ruminiclostridium sp.]|nr:type II toxin-antitoxin system VapC family toxin [Ruminiclostridium sp.]
MKYLLDTNICIYAQKGNKKIIDKIQANFEDGIAISSITLAELEYGVQASIFPQKNAVALMKFLLTIDVLPFDDDCAVKYGKIRADLKKKGTLIGAMDMLIAAHGLSKGLIVVTHNTKEFERVEGLTIEDWFE